jgi:hypothetical protein
VRPFFRSIACASALSLCACRDPASSGHVPAFVTLRTAAPSYDAGSRVTVQITNHSSFVLSFNACFMRLDRLTERGWRELGAAEAGACTDELRGVLPMTGLNAQVTLSPHVGAGAYRIRFDRMYVKEQFAPDDGLVPREQLTTNGFAIR